MSVGGKNHAPLMTKFIWPAHGVQNWSFSVNAAQLSACSRHCPLVNTLLRFGHTPIER